MNFLHFCKRAIFLPWLFLFPGLLSGQAQMEKVFLHTDKPFYLTGETIWFKAYCVDAAHQLPSQISSVLYVELLDQEGQPIIQKKIRLQAGTGKGQLFVESQIPTQTCYIRAYTAWMRNFDPDFFYEKPLNIFNPFSTDTGGITSTEKDSSLQEIHGAGEKGLVIRVEDTIVGYRERVNVKVNLNGDSGDMAELSVAVYKYVPQLEGKGDHIVGALQQSVESDMLTTRPAFPPEIHAPIIQGKIAPNSGIGQINVSFPGEHTQLYGVNVDSSGRFYLEVTPRMADREMLFWSPTYAPLSGKIELTSFFATAGINNPVSGPPLDEAVLPMLESYSLNTQVANAYLNFSEIRGIDPAPGFPGESFYGTPDITYEMKKYVRFPLVDEVFVEIVNFVIRKKKKQEVYIWDLYANDQSISNSIYFDQPGLMMIDGIPVKDLNIAWNMEAAKLKAIHLLKRKYFAGNQVYYGIINLITHKGNFAGLDLPDYLYRQPYKGLQIPKVFASPDYSTPEQRSSRVPDYRSVLYWNPDLQIKPNNPGSLSFFTSDDAGTYRIVINGLTSTGTPLHGVATFYVQTEP